MKITAILAAVLGMAAFLFAGEGMRSTRVRFAGKGLLHAAHFDAHVRPSRAERRAMAPGLRSVWVLRDERSVVTTGSFAKGLGALAFSLDRKAITRVAACALVVAGILAVLNGDAHGFGLAVIAVPKLKEKSEELNAVRGELKKIFDEAGSEMDMSKVTSIEGSSEDKVSHIRQLNDKAAALDKEVGNLTMLQRSAEIADLFEEGTEAGSEGRADGKNFVDKLFESEAIKGGLNGPESEIMLPETRQMRSTREQIKNALFTTGAGWEPESTRSGRIDLSAQEMPAVVDLVPMITTDTPLFKFMRETVFTNAATETAEGGAYAEAALQLAEAEEAIRKVTIWIGVTDEQTEDVPGARAYVESRLRFMLEQKLDQRLLYGNPAAVPPQIRGFHNTAGINSEDGTDFDIPDVVLNGATKARVVGQAMADGVVLHPYDWTRVRLQRTADGIYIWGHPSQVGPATLWGMPVVDSANEVEGAGLTGAFKSQSLLVVKRGVTVKVSDSHDDFFIEGKQAIRADFRAALVTIRPGAFTELENLGAVTP